MQSKKQKTDPPIILQTINIDSERDRKTERERERERRHLRLYIFCEIMGLYFFLYQTKNICSMKRHKTQERISRQDEVETLIVDLHMSEASSIYDLQTLTCSCHYLHEACFTLVAPQTIHASIREMIGSQRAWCLLFFVSFRTVLSTEGFYRVSNKCKAINLPP